jgi:hypothetical protein
LTFVPLWFKTAEHQMTTLFPKLRQSRSQAIQFRTTASLGPSSSANQSNRPQMPETQEQLTDEQIKELEIARALARFNNFYQLQRLIPPTPKRIYVDGLRLRVWGNQ